MKIECSCFENCRWNDSWDAYLFPSLRAKVSVKKRSTPSKSESSGDRGIFFERKIVDSVFFSVQTKWERTRKGKLCDTINLSLSVNRLQYLDSRSISIWKIYYICLYWIQGGKALFRQQSLPNDAVRMRTSLLAGCLVIEVPLFFSSVNKSLWSSEAEICF